MESTARNNRLRRWELALLIGVACAILSAAYLTGQQAALADKVIRLHVIANSDSEADQSLKLAVRDHILQTAFPLLDGKTVGEAEEILRAHTQEITSAAAEEIGAQGYDYRVTASVEQSYFPTKQYPDFALPAGNYTALRVVIGDGAGENWWCVVFPPLCLGSVTETAAETALSSGMTTDQVNLMTADSDGYVLKFKSIELLQQLLHRLGL